jgi:hypothetical protein
MIRLRFVVEFQLISSRFLHRHFSLYIFFIDQNIERSFYFKIAVKTVETNDYLFDYSNIYSKKKAEIVSQIADYHSN